MKRITGEELTQFLRSRRGVFWVVLLVVAFLPADLLAQDKEALCHDAQLQLTWIQATLAGYGAGALLGLWILAPELAGLFAISAALMQMMISLGC
jgi:hypothetical protein